MLCTWDTWSTHVFSKSAKIILSGGGRRTAIFLVLDSMENYPPTFPRPPPPTLPLSVY